MPRKRSQAKHSIYVKIQKYELTHSDRDFLGKSLVISWGDDKGKEGRTDFPRDIDSIKGMSIFWDAGGIHHLDCSND